MPDSQQTMDAMVGEVFELTKLIYAARSRQPSGPEDLSETEFLTLDLLAKEEALTIGEIQKRIEAKERVLVTTLTKRTAEDLSQYLRDAGLREQVQVFGFGQRAIDAACPAAGITAHRHG